MSYIDRFIGLLQSLLTLALGLSCFCMGGLCFSTDPRASFVLNTTVGIAIPAAVVLFLFLLGSNFAALVEENEHNGRR